MMENAKNFRKGNVVVQRYEENDRHDDDVVNMDDSADDDKGGADDNDDDAHDVNIDIIHDGDPRTGREMNGVAPVTATIDASVRQAPTFGAMQVATKRRTSPVIQPQLSGRYSTFHAKTAKLEERISHVKIVQF